MRISSGTARGRRIKTAKSMTVRPTSGRVKEAIFDILGQDFTGARVLDLYAGSGGLGLEALSRGAARAVFVERSRAAAGSIRRNLETLGFSQADVLAMDVFRYLQLAGRKTAKFTHIFADPPYRLFEQHWISQLWEGVATLLEMESVFIVEHPSSWTGPPATGELQLEKTRRYGQTSVSFYRFA